MIQLARDRCRYILFALVYSTIISMLLSWQCSKANAKNLEEFFESLPSMGWIISFLLSVFAPDLARPLPLLLKSTAQ